MLRESTQGDFLYPLQCVAHVFSPVYYSEISNGLSDGGRIPPITVVPLVPFTTGSLWGFRPPPPESPLLYLI